MNLLLTGGTGYIGSHTAVLLLEAGHNVLLFDNLSNSNSDVANRIKKLTTKEVGFAEGDINDTKLLSKTIRDHHIDTVIHFAGLKSVYESVLYPLDYFNNNVGGTISLLKAMQENQLRKLVFSSSATVYGIPDYLPIDEDHPTSAINPYGKTKLHIEEMLQELVSSDSTWSIASLRYFNPVGAHASSLIGEEPSGKPNNLMPLIAQVAVGKLEYLNIFGNDYPTLDGTGVRDYIHVVDLAQGHLDAVAFLNKNKGYNVFNLGTGVGYSVFEMIQAFEKVSGKKINYKIMPRRLGDIASCYADASRAKKQLDWQAHYSLQDMCTSVWRWISKN